MNNLLDGLFDSDDAFVQLLQRIVDFGQFLFGVIRIVVNETHASILIIGFTKLIHVYL